MPSRLGGAASGTFAPTTGSSLRISSRTASLMRYPGLALGPVDRKADVDVAAAEQRRHLLADRLVQLIEAAG